MVDFIGTGDDALIKLEDDSTTSWNGSVLTITGAATVNQTFSLADTAFSIVIADGYTLNFTDNVTMTTGVANTITVESGGTLNVSLLSQDQTAAMAGDIKVKTGANVTYHGRGETSYTVLGDNGAMITLGTGGRGHYEPGRRCPVSEHRRCHGQRL